MGNIPFMRRWTMARAVWLALLLAMTAPQSMAARPEQADTVTRQLSYNDLRRYQYFFLGGLVQEEKGNLAAAFDLYRHALEINFNDPEVYSRIGILYFSLKQPDKAQECLEKAVRLDSTNVNYLQNLAQIYYIQEQYMRAIETYEQLYSYDKSRTDVLNILLNLYGHTQQYDKALGVLDRIELTEGVSTQTVFSRMHIYVLQDEGQKSKNVLVDLVKKNPYDNNYKLMLGNWLINDGHTKEARKVLQEVLREEPRNVLARTSMLDYYEATKQKDKYHELLWDLLGSKDTPFDSRWALTLHAIQHLMDDSDSTKMMEVFDHALAAPQEKADIYLLKASAMVQRDFPIADIKAVCRDALKIEPDNSNAQGLLLQLMGTEGKYDEIIDFCRSAQQYSPSNMDLYYYKCFAEYQLKENDDALSSLQKAVELRNEDADSTILSDSYMLMGEIYHERMLNKECYAAYDSCLYYQPDNFGAMNNYAYYLSQDKGSNLKKAEEMSRKTVQAYPDNATFLDTYAWILFKERRYGDAKSVIEHAMRCDSTLNNVVIEHCGDILYMAGEPERALELWKEAAKKGNASATLQRKIELKKYIEE